MRTTVVIEDKTFERLMELGGFKSKRQAIQTAINEFISRAERNALTEMAGEIEFEQDHLHTLHQLEDGEGE